MLYWPLSARSNHIRLLVLHPGNVDDKICCSLILHDLERSQWPKFEALSYTWGDPLDTSPITLKGQDFAVTRNLEAALRALRMAPSVEGDTRKYDRFLWVDAICINQKDEPECSKQVLRMRDIYRAAETTIIWLGEATVESDKAMAFMDQNHGRASNMDQDLLKARNYREEYLALVEGLVIRPWWFRMWIVQEVVVSNQLRVMCGSRTIAWKSLIRFIAIADEYHKPAVSEILRKHPAEEVPNSNLGIKLAFMRREWRNSGPQNILQLLMEFRTCKATKPSDKIYGVLGMTVEADHPTLKPDYNHPTHKVFSAVTKLIIEQKQKLDCICLAAGPREFPNSPTWTPDFTVPGMRVPNPLKGNARLLESYLYSAAKEVPMSVSFSDDSSILYSKGIRADVVDCMAPYWDPHCAVADFVPAIRESVVPSWSELVRPLMLEINARYGPNFSWNLARGKTLTADRFMNYEGNVSRFEPGRSWSDLPVEPPEEYKNVGSPQEHNLQWEYDKQTMIEGALTQRCFMITKGGYIGLVPMSARKDDVICVLFGCDTPLVLRPVNDHYELVGECYVYGLMDGELVDILEEGKASRVSFEIR